MSPDDERHGTRRGYYAHRRDNEEACGPCKRGAAGAQARHEMLRSLGIEQRVNPVGTRRRLQALVALGWTFRALDRELGVANMAEKWSNEDRDYVFHGSRAKVAALYDRLSMQFPPETTRGQRINATRARNLAAKRGWPPPLAWDDIDDPEERPHGWRYADRPRSKRHETLLELDDQLAGISVACNRLDITRQALQKWCDRNDANDLYRRLAAREEPRYWVNQHAEAAG